MTPAEWVGIVVTILGAAWYLATRLGKQDARIAVLEVTTSLVHSDVKYLREAKETELKRRLEAKERLASKLVEGRLRMIEGGRDKDAE